MRVPLPAAFLTTPIAHRAYHDVTVGRPENSRAAVKAAIAAGYGIEIDLQLSRDGVAMVFHDETLERITPRTGRLRDLNTTELDRTLLNASSESIPTFAEILSLIAGRVPLLVELKDQTLRMEQTDGRLETATIKALQSYDGPVALMSFNPHCLAQLAHLAPHIPRGITTSAYNRDDWTLLPPDVCDRLRSIPDYDHVKASFISHEADDLSRPRVAELAAHGAAILCWTIKSPKAEAAARRIAQNITFEGYAAAIPA